MAFFIGRDREVRRAYGLDEVAIVPGNITIDPEDVDTSVQLCGHTFQIPLIASAMDGVVSPKMAIALSRLKGLGVLNLDGVFTRYENPEEQLQRIVEAEDKDATALIQRIYQEPIKEELIVRRVREIKEAGAVCAVSSIPANAPRNIKIAREAGADIYVIQATVVTTKHYSKKHGCVDLEKICKESGMPVIIGNCVTYAIALQLMEIGASGILVGVGPGAACTSRQVLGLGVPQITATIDCAAARDYYFKKTGRYVPVITDGGLVNGGDICKSFVAGADAVMFGSGFAKAVEAPGKGYHWGMAMPHMYLPRGSRIYVGTTGTIQEILLGPAKTDDGTQNLVGALRTCMGNVGAFNLKELQLAQLIIAPGIKTEGKVYQKAQRVGMGR